MIKTEWIMTTENPSDRNGSNQDWLGQKREGGTNID